MPGQPDVCRTTIGSRPGGSFADVVFTFLFTRVLDSFYAQLREQGLLDRIRVDPRFDPFGSDSPSVGSFEDHTGPVWMDDLCVYIQASVEGAVNKASVVTSLLLDTLEAHAMTPNLSRGKTELLMSLRGRGVRLWRTRLFGPLSSGTLPVLCELLPSTSRSSGSIVILAGYFTIWWRSSQGNATPSRTSTSSLHCTSKRDFPEWPCHSHQKSAVVRDFDFEQVALWPLWM